MNEDLDLTHYEDSSELIKATAGEALELVAKVLNEKGVCHIALTGGTLGEALASELLELLNARPNDFAGLHIWFSDERFVSRESPLRNARAVRIGLKSLSVTVHEVKSTESALSVIEAAASYADELANITMDLCFLGLGPDGHVASLFPNQWDALEEARAIAIVYSPKPPPERVSFSKNYINSSEQVWIIADGALKAKAVTQLLEGGGEIPAGHIKARKITRLIIDKSALFTEH